MIWLAVGVLFLLSNGFASDFKSKVIELDRHWVFLEPEVLETEELNNRLNELAKHLTPRSLKRRSKLILVDPPIRQSDLLPSDERIAKLEAIGLTIVRQIRYINAVVVRGDATAFEFAIQLDFVKSIRPVLGYFPEKNAFDVPTESTSQIKNFYPTIQQETYGESWHQNAMVNVPAAHSDGYTGKGVLIGVQDTGFDNLPHKSFRHLQVVGTYDFINNTPDVTNNGGIGSGAHGSRVLGVIAGLDSGNFIGVAPHAQFVLTKTENTTIEHPIEEDHWVMGLWYHDSIGVDVLNSSLTYSDWYDWSDMNGETAVTTMATDSAVMAGMFIVNAMGNSGRDEYPFTKMGAPSDAKYILSAGGARSDSLYWSGASQGPSYDGRIKPELSALATNVLAPHYNDSYLARTGTSFSAPILSGVVALVLQANPELTPFQMMEVLKRAAHQHDSPDTLLGWGIPDAVKAIEIAKTLSVNMDNRVEIKPHEFALNSFPNPFNGITTIEFYLHQSDFVRVNVFDANGRLMQTVSEGEFKSGKHSLQWDSGFTTAGVYFIQLSVGRQTVKHKVVLLK